MTRTYRTCIAVLTAISVAALVYPAFGPAEVTQKRNVRLKVLGQMVPTKLPRHGAEPVAVSVAAHITPTKRGKVPKLTRITIDLNRYGRIDSRGIPLCRLGHINPSTTREALLACGRSLIGEGRFTSKVRIPDQSPFPSIGKVLAFNGRLRGKPTIFAHIFGRKPVPTSYVLPFSIRHSKGTYGTILEASLPQVTGEWGYVTGISLNLDRDPRKPGQRGGYVKAGCPAPSGVHVAAFPLARTTFSFEGGLDLSSTLNRSCTARED
jgi:hypothetical protein